MTAEDATRSDPAAADPATAEDATRSDPAGTDPAGTDPAGTDPAGTDPASTDPAGAEPASTDPATADLATAEPATAEPPRPEPARAEPPRVADERTMLDAWLEYYRATLMHKVSGLSAEQLTERSCPPSPMSPIGLVRHMVEMERAYAHRLAEPDLPLLYCTDESPDGDFEDVSAGAADEDRRLFAEYAAKSRGIMGAAELDDTFGRHEPYSLRWVYLYLIKEYARHLGHVDLLRERIDGATGE